MKTKNFIVTLVLMIFPIAGLAGFAYDMYIRFFKGVTPSLAMMMPINMLCGISLFGLGIFFVLPIKIQQKILIHTLLNRFSNTILYFTRRLRLSGVIWIIGALLTFFFVFRELVS